MFKKYREMLDGNTTFAFGLGPLEAIIIAIVIIALFFGGKKLGDWARGLGRFSTEFRRGKMEAEQQLKDLESSIKNDDAVKEKK